MVYCTLKNVQRLPMSAGWGHGGEQGRNGPECTDRYLVPLLRTQRWVIGKKYVPGWLPIGTRVRIERADDSCSTGSGGTAERFPTFSIGWRVWLGRFLKDPVLHCAKNSMRGYYSAIILWDKKSQAFLVEIVSILWCWCSAVFLLSPLHPFSPACLRLNYSHPLSAGGQVNNRHVANSIARYTWF